MFKEVNFEAFNIFYNPASSSFGNWDEQLPQEIWHVLVLNHQRFVNLREKHNSSG